MRRSATLAGIVLIATLTPLCYFSALQGDFLWDDDHYVTQNDTLKTPQGLRRIWGDPRATPQYYPLVFTTFWIEYRLWGLNPLGFHLTNVFLHAANAVLLWCLLRALSVPGAWLAAAAFALHPVHVESVAWITERKNVLSGFFFLASFLAYWRFHVRSVASPGKESRLFLFRGPYLLALGLFLLALLSKTVAVSLPAVILIVLLWRYAPLRGKALLPLTPFFVLGLPFAWLTIWLEKHHVGAIGMDWSLTFGERVLVAGRALWFYLGKLLVPLDLMFNYPRWQVDPRELRQFLYPLGFLALVVAAAALRRRITGGPAAALASYCVAIMPALGLFDIYPMRYSFVADHFQYLASLSIIALLAAIARRVTVVGCSRLVPTARAPEACVARTWIVVSALVLAGLGFLTWKQAQTYRGPEVLWRATLARNPESWLSHINLGSLLERRGQLEEARGHFLAALRVRPGHANALFNLGVISERQGRSNDARDYFERAVQADQLSAPAAFRLGSVVDRQGDVAGARRWYEGALKLDASLAPFLVNRAVELQRAGRRADALTVLDGILRVVPAHARARYNRAVVLQETGDESGAREDYEQALRLEPEHALAHNNLALLLIKRGEYDRARIHLQSALRLDPKFAGARLNLGYLSEKTGDLEGAARSYDMALALDPTLDAAKSGLARARQLLLQAK